MEKNIQANEVVELTTQEAHEMVDRWLQFDEEMADLVLLAIKELESRMKHMEEAIANKDANLLKELTHSLKGVTGNFHMDELYEILVAVDQYLKENKNIDQSVHNYIDQLIKIVSLIPAEYYDMVILPPDLEFGDRPNVSVLVSVRQRKGVEWIQQLSENEQVRIVTANTGLEVLEQYYMETFDLLIIDEKMPLMNAEEVMEVINDDHSSKSQKNIILHEDQSDNQVEFEKNQIDAESISVLGGLMKTYKRILLSTCLFLIVLILMGCTPQEEVSEENNVNGEGQSDNLEVNESIKEAENEIETASDDVLRLYISADRSGTKESGISIEQGVRTALDEVDYMLNGTKLELIVLDHRGSTPRFEQHLQTYLEDDRSIAMFSGLHSPPILAKRDFINENAILLLDPWAAATPITRYPSSDNWIFRLSIDDSKAGFVIVEHAVEEGFSNPYLLLEETGWGAANETTMTAALKEYSIEQIETQWFNWNLGTNQAKMMLRQAKSNGADVIFFVGNAPEGKVFAQAMSELSVEERLPIRSHWGITGGDFPKIIDKPIRDKIDLLFLQTRFSFVDMDENEQGEKVLKHAIQLFEEVERAEDIQAPTGFIHSYDLSKLLLEAMGQIEWTGDINADRKALRNNLESIESPVIGLIKTYEKPFGEFSSDSLDAHEALGIEDFVMAKYGDLNEIKLLN